MIRRTFALALIGCVVLRPALLPAQNVAPDPPAPTEKAIAALLDLDQSTIGPLVQQSLAQNGHITWVERDSLDAVLKEQALENVLGAAAGSERMALGKLLKADVLILLRMIKLPAPAGPANAPPARQLDVVVSETKQGLRLARGSFLLGKDTIADVREVEPVVTRGLQKLRERVTTVCAVPAFVSGDLLYEFDYLKTALPKIIETSLLEQPGMLVVELPEAQSLARELALAGAPALDRPLPLFLLGDYRNSGSGDSRTLTVSLRLLRGDTEVAAESKADLPAAELSTFLVRTSEALLAKVAGHPLLPADPAAEARQLAERARVLMRLASWDEAMSLVEASLLLEPGRTEVLRDAVIISTPLAKRAFQPTKDVAVLGQGLRDYRRGLEHIETFLQQVSDLKPYVLPGKNMTIVDQYPFFNLPRRKPPPELADLHAEVLQAHRDTLLRLTRVRAEILSRDPAVVASDGTVPGVRVQASDLSTMQSQLQNLEIASIGGDMDDYRYLWFATDGLPPQQRFNTIRRLIDDLQGLPGFRGRAYRFARGCYPVRIFQTAEAGNFLARLRSDSRPEVASAAERISKELAEELALPQQFTPYPEYRYGAPNEPQLPPADVKISFREIAPTYTRDDGQVVVLKALQGCQQVGPNNDVMWINNRLLQMEEKGKAKLVASVNPRNATVFSSAFDGKYLWLVWQGNPGQTPMLVVMDPVSKKLSQLTVENGLPLPRPKEVNRSNYRQTLQVAPIEPGKVCMAGCFGHSWVSITTFDPNRQPNFDIKIFVQGLEEPDATKPEQASRKGVAFAPGLMGVVEGSLPGKEPGKRIVVPRRGANEVLYEHPLLIHPETLKVEIIDEAYPHHYAPQMPPATHEGVLYSICAFPNYPTRDIQFCRFGFPDFKKEVLFHNMPQGRVVFAGGRLHIVGKKWWVGNLAKGEFGVANDKLPWYFTNGWNYPGEEPKASGSDIPVGIFHSAHYGLIVSARRSETALVAVDMVPRPVE